MSSFPKESQKILLVDSEVQAKIDDIKKEIKGKDSVAIYPFNPNFITDYKGYTLGMSPVEIDRLHIFRSKGTYVNSAEEFQKATLVSDSLLNAISPYFKFPEWTKKSDVASITDNQSRESRKVVESSNTKTEIKDLNSVTPADLKSINGIGEKLSARIIKFRDRLGGFLIDEQLYDVYGLEPDVATRALKRFKVIKAPKIEKIDLNTASAKELSELVYIQKHVAESIINYRNLNGSIDSFDELTKIQGFPAERIERIALYLSLKK